MEYVHSISSNRRFSISKYKWNQICLWDTFKIIFDSISFTEIFLIYIRFWISVQIVVCLLYIFPQQLLAVTSDVDIGLHSPINPCVLWSFPAMGTDYVSSNKMYHSSHGGGLSGSLILVIWCRRSSNTIAASWPTNWIRRRKRLRVCVKCSGHGWSHF